ncbi:M48 family metalloprotease [Streptomyces sp. 4.24]|uniref:M48 family metalloprotease n=1 Tax=Streptomyces tritrimontium TaxID=3406573 RepID=UPI003BB4C07F
MSANARRTPSEPLDPFVLPHGVKFRFVLLVTALTGTSAFIYNLLYYAVAPGADETFADYQRCIAAPPEVAPVTDPGTYTRGVLSCTAAFEREKAWWILAGLVLMAAAAMALYWVFPRLRMWRDRLEPLEPEDDPEDAALLGVLESPVTEAGLHKAPRFLVARRRPQVAAITFGRVGDYRVRLNGGLLTEGRQDPELLRTIVLHELGHVRNKDVDITHLTAALALAFVPLGLVPLAVALAGMDARDVLGVAWRAAVLVALVCVSAAAVLRAREFGADARADAVSGTRPGLLRLLNTVAARESRRPGWLRPLDRHPRAKRRADELARPTAQFRIGFGECFAVGLAATITAAGLHTLLWLGFNHLAPRDSRWLVALVLAPAVVTVVGTALWRATISSGSGTAQARDGRPPTVLPAVGLAAGCVAGRLVAAENGILQSDGLPAPTVTEAAWSVVLCLLVVLLFRWIVQGATVWLAPDGRPAGRSWPVGVAAAVVPLAVLLGWWLLLYDLSDGLGPVNAEQRADHRAIAAVAPVEAFWPWAALEHPMAQLFYRWTPAVLAAVTLWALPLAALWRRRAAGPSSRWARWVVVTSLAGSAGFAVAVLGTRAYVHLGVAEERRRQVAYVLAFTHWNVAAAAVLQGLVALVVTAGLYRVHGRVAVLFGLMAAFVTGCLATGVVFAGSVVGGCWNVFSLASGPCVVDLELAGVRDTLLRVVVAGTACAVAGAGAAAVAGSWWARRRPPGAPPAPVPVSRRERTVLGLATLLAFAVVVTGLSVGTTTATVGAPPPAPPSRTGTGAAAPACAKYDRVMGAGDSMNSADKNAELFDAIRLAADGGNVALATALQDLLRAVPTGDLPAFSAARKRIAEQCAQEGAPL